MPAMNAVQGAGAGGGSRAARLRTLVLLTVWALSIGYMAERLKVGWVPHDEGTLGLSAERVLQGQLPHRDFDDYTGGLTFLNAAAFRLFGINSASMRYVLFGFFIPWVPSVFFVASRFTSAVAAGAVTLLAVAWSMPNYPAPMPSWYNLYFATWGVAALLRHLESGSPWWLFAAGLCGGLSMLAKVTAAYYVAGVLLFFVFREQNLNRQAISGKAGRGLLYRGAVGTGLAVFMTLLFRMIRTVPGASGLIYFVLPAAALMALILAREFAGPGGEDRRRFATLFGLCIPFVVGLLVPMILFAIPYATAGAVWDLVRGLLAAPARAIRFASFDPYHPLTMIAMLPWLLLLIAAYESGQKGRTICGGAAALYGCAILYFAGKSKLAYFLGWCALGTAVPLLVAAGARMLWRRRRENKADETREQERIMLLLGVTALCSVIQFPFSAPVYFFYAAPLVILCGAALLSTSRRPPKLVLGVAAGIYVLFPMLLVTAYRMGVSHDPEGKTERLRIERAGGLRVDPFDAQLYDRLIPLVQAHAKATSIYAAPDCPEVYFLSGYPRHSRHYFDYAEERQGRTERILKELEERGVNVVAIKEEGQFTGALWPELRRALEERYPSASELDAFEVRWKQ